MHEDKDKEKLDRATTIVLIEMMGNLGGTMIKTICLFTLVSVALSLAATELVSIYDIQFTTNPGCEGTYPSPMCGKVVGTSGVVTAIDTDAGVLYMSGLQGGEWNSICVKAGDLMRGRRIRPGVRVEVVGKVAELFGMTTLIDVTELTTSGAQATLPETTATTGAVRMDEGLEAALIRLQNVTINDHASSQWTIDDGSGTCIMGDEFDTLESSRIDYDGEGEWIEARGVVVYRYGEFSVNPRTVFDLGGQTSLNVNQTSWGRVKSLYR